MIDAEEIDERCEAGKADEACDGMVDGDGLCGDESVESGRKENWWDCWLGEGQKNVVSRVFAMRAGVDAIRIEWSWCSLRSEDVERRRRERERRDGASDHR